MQRIVAGLLRCLALMLTLEVSGGLHAALDMAAAAGLYAHPDDDCDSDGRECPPGCVSCHCGAHTAPWGGSNVSLLDGEPMPHAPSAKPFAYEGFALRGPERGRLDRPPRV